MAFLTGAEPTHGTLCSHSGSILTWPFTLVLETHTLHRMLAQQERTSVAFHMGAEDHTWDLMFSLQALQPLSQFLTSLMSVLKPVLWDVYYTGENKHVQTNYYIWLWGRCIFFNTILRSIDFFFFNVNAMDPTQVVTLHSSALIHSVASLASIVFFFFSKETLKIFFIFCVCFHVEV